MWQRLQRHRLAQVGFAIILILLLLAIFAPLISPLDPQEPREGGMSLLGEPHRPGDGFLLGADSLGRDVWTRTLYGARISLLIGFSAMITAVFIGTTVGLLSGFFGGWVMPS
jgi:peptide/nickel transport system permease protein